MYVDTNENFQYFQTYLKGSQKNPKGLRKMIFKKKISFFNLVMLLKWWSSKIYGNEKYSHAYDLHH
jgi:hypothetical protein